MLYKIYHFDPDYKEQHICRDKFTIVACNSNYISPHWDCGFTVTDDPVKYIGWKYNGDINLGSFTREQYASLLGAINVKSIKFVESCRIRDVIDAIPDTVHTLKQPCWESRDVDYLIANLHKLRGLKSLDFGDIQVNEKQLLALTQNINGISELKITIYCTEDNEPTVHKLFGIGLTELKLRIVYPHFYDDLLFDSIESDTTIKYLNLYVEDLSELGSTKLALALGKNRSIRALTYNDDIGTLNQIFPEAFAGSRNIKHFDTNMIDCENMLALISMTTLERIHFHEVSDQMVMQYNIDKLLRENYSLTYGTPRIINKWALRNELLTWEHVHRNLMKFMILLGSMFDGYGFDQFVITEVFDWWYQYDVEKFHYERKTRLIDEIRNSIRKVKIEGAKKVGEFTPTFNSKKCFDVCC